MALKKTAHILKQRESPSLLSIVIPFYNEQEVLPLLRKELNSFFETLPCPAEVICVNDGSNDETLFLLDEWARHDNRIRLLSFARNFGHQTAVTAGLDVVKGDAVVIMDADLQDPPRVEIEMLRKYSEGFDVVYGLRE